MVRSVWVWQCGLSLSLGLLQLLVLFSFKINSSFMCLWHELHIDYADRNVTSQTSAPSGAFKDFSVAITILPRSTTATQLPLSGITSSRSRALSQKTMHFSDISTILSTF